MLLFLTMPALQVPTSTREVIKKLFSDGFRRIKINAFHRTFQITFENQIWNYFLEIYSAKPVNDISNRIHSSGSQMPDRIQSTVLVKRSIFYYISKQIYLSDICLIRATSTYCHKNWKICCVHVCLYFYRSILLHARIPPTDLCWFILDKSEFFIYFSFFFFLFFIFSVGMKPVLPKTVT